MARLKIRCSDPKAGKLQAELCESLAGKDAAFRDVFTALAASETFVSHFYGRLPFVLECGELVAKRWTLEDQLSLLRHESYEVYRSSKAERKPIQLKLGLETGSWVISSGNSLSPNLAEVCQALQSSFQVPFVTTNVYISRLDSPVTAPLHTDRFDSFIMQTEGAKRWRIYATSQEVPSWPVLDAGMTDRGKAGDVLYLEKAKTRGLS
ncbi:unnamed protein product [Effrenium voratum]|nr:unnamed protein product [Effrenium voratum]